MIPVWVLIFVLTVKLNGAENIYAAYEARNTLLKDILSNYQPSARPVRGNETVMLSVNIEIQHFDFREKTGAFHLVGLLHAKWHDPKLVWNPKRYANTSHILVNQRHIWVPDLEFYNNAPDKFMKMDRNGFVSVKNDGLVFWSDFIEINVFCSNDMKNWPHDKHDCSMVLGSWTFDGLELDIMDLEANSSMMLNSIENKNMEYKITKFNASHVKKYYSCCLQPYVSLDYNITFERQSSYAIIFRMPALTVTLFTLIALRMEPSRTEKLWLNGLSIILITCQLIYFAGNIGHFHDTPNIVTFYGTSFVMVTIAQLLAVFSLFVTHSRIKGHLPQYIETILNSSLMWYLVRTEFQINERDEINEQFEDVKLDDASNLIENNLLKNDWLRFAKVLNVLAFLIFCFIFIVTTSIFIV